MIWNRNEQSPIAEKSIPVTELADPADLARCISGAKKTVVFFEMTGCPYCIAYESRFADLVRERCKDLDFVRVKLDDPRNPLWNQYDIHAVPAFIAFANGGIVARADSVLALGLSKRKWVEFQVGI